ncbi:MAG: response regulator transcription factor [Pseudomonadota bacterium]
MSEKIRVLIADDHAIVREGALRLLNAQPDMEVVGEASDGREVLAKAMEIKPDVLVLDISMPGLTGLDLVPMLRQSLPETQIAVLSVHNKQAFVQQILHSGALAYVLKTSPTSDLLAAIRAVHQGEYYLSGKVRAEVIGSYLRQPLDDAAAAGYARLSEREQQVFRLVAKGHTNREIADILFLSPRTVEKYRAQAMAKLDLKDLVEVIHYAIQHGLVAPEN